MVDGAQRLGIDLLSCSSNQCLISPKHGKPCLGKEADVAYQPHSFRIGSTLNVIPVMSKLAVPTIAPSYP